MMQPCRSFTRHCLGGLAAFAVAASGAGLANGPMGGGGGGGPQGGGGGIFIPSIPMSSGAPPSGGQPEGPGGWGPGAGPYGNYPPGGRPDRNQQLIDQIRQNGQAGRERDAQRARDCRDLRVVIARLSSGGGFATKAYANEATDQQRQFDQYSRMSSAQIDAEIRDKQELLRDAIHNRDHGGVAIHQRDIAFLQEMKRLRARYGTGYVYQNELKATSYYKAILELNEEASLSRRDDDEPELRDARAEYAELDCDRGSAL